MADYYGTDDTGPSDEGPADEQDMSEKDSGGTYLINSQVCPDMAAGDMLTLKITRVLDKEYEVQYVPEKEEESAESEPATASGPSTTGMSSMFE